MPEYRVEFRKSALKEFDKTPPKIQDKILEAITLLKASPFSEILDIKKMKGAEKLFRLRIGDWRLVYEVKNGPLLIVITKIGNRKEVYRWL